MKLPRYPLQTTNDFQEYSFFSDGPKGRIKKVVIYSVLQEEPLVYNLAFGDVDPKNGMINDTVISNNHDRDIVLATVASTIHLFCDRHGNHLIYVTGSTKARTRLYQISVTKLINEIRVDFDLYGDNGTEIVKFECNVNYQAILIRRK